MLIFGRRVFVYIKSFAKAKKRPDKATDGEAEDTVSKKRISSDHRAKVEELCQRGEALIKAGKDDEAVKCFVQALTLDELHMETQHKLAMLYLGKQMYSAAAALFKQIAELNEDPVSYSHLGLAYYQQNEYTSALDAYKKAVDLDPSRPNRFVSLAQVYRALGQFNHAVVALNKAMEMDEKNIELLCLLAHLQIELKDFNKARELIGQILEVEPENEVAKELKAEIKRLQMEGP